MLHRIIRNSIRAEFDHSESYKGCIASFDVVQGLGWNIRSNAQSELDIRSSARTESDNSE